MARSIKPLTLRRVVEAADLASREPCIDANLLSRKLEVRRRRAREILLELEQMNLLCRAGNGFSATDLTHKLLECYEKEDWHSIHDIFCEHNIFYRLLVNTLSDSSVALSKHELLQKLSAVGDLNFNVTSIDIVCDWAERLGSVQRNLYTNEYYLLSKQQPQSFSYEAERCYAKLNVELRPGLRLEYVEISRLREETCENLRMAREAFDKNLESMLQSRVGEVDLCGGPVTTSAKKIPSTLKIIERTGKQSILSPRYSVVKEGKGIEISGKLYHYVAFFHSGE